MSPQDLQQDVLNKMHNGLVDVQKKLNTPMLFGHLCKGDLSSSGVLRVSKVASAKPQKIGSQIFENHDEALLNHVKRFGREKTLLNWLVCWTRVALDKMDKYEPNIFLAASFMTHIDDQKPLIHVKNIDLTVSISLSKKLLRTLVPDDLAERYVEGLYHNNNSSFGVQNHPIFQLRRIRLGF